MSDLVIEQFKAWFAENYPKINREDCAQNVLFKMIAEQAWQASRAAIVVELPEPFAWIGDYAACGGGKSVFDRELAEKIDDRMCKKTPVYDASVFEALGLKVAK